MLNTRKRLLLSVITVVTITIFLGLSEWRNGTLTSTAQDQTGVARDDKQKDEFPIALYSASLPNERARRALRHIRNSRYDKRYPVPFDELPPDTTEKLIACDWSLTPALPIAESEAIVLAQVVTAIGYLSNDKTGAYSEFTIIIKEVLKTDGRFSFVPDSSIVVEREGAAVQLPSGRIIRTGFASQGMPRIGRQYVLFLKYNNQGEDYQIVTGYELRNKRVVPLDQVEPFTSYTGADVRSFLNTVHEAMANPPEKKRLNQ
jgi:hypothetical protein